MERLTTESAHLLHATIREARELLTQALRKVRTMREQPARAQVRAVVELAQFVARAEQVAEQVRQRSAGEPIKDRLVSIFDIHARAHAHRPGGGAALRTQARVGVSMSGRGQPSGRE